MDQFHFDPDSKDQYDSTSPIYRPQAEDPSTYQSDSGYSNQFGYQTQPPYSTQQTDTAQPPYQAPYQTPYQSRQPSYSRRMGWVDDSPLSVCDYFLMYLVMLIPIANIIMLFVWAFGDCNLNKKNWARFILILYGIAFVILLILIIVPAIITASQAAAGYHT